MNFFHRKQQAALPYDTARQEPAVRSSICTGEMTLGFLDREGGVFHEYMLVRDRVELEAFCRKLGVAPEEIRRIY